MRAAGSLVMTEPSVGVIWLMSMVVTVMMAKIKTTAVLSRTRREVVGMPSLRKPVHGSLMAIVDAVD